MTGAGAEPGIRCNELGQPVGAPLPDWQPARLPPRTAMQGRYCRVEPLEPDRHGEDLFAAFAADREGRGWTYLPYGPFPAPGPFQDWLHQAASGSDPLFHAIVAADSGRACGLASFLRIEPGTGCIEVGHIHYAPALQRRPAATEAMYLMMARVFDELGYRRYEWKCDSLNAPSRAAALRLGFSYEGLFRQATIYRGRNRDTAWYSVIDAEWPMLRAAFRAWLDPANFDVAGRQRRSLAALRQAAADGRAGQPD